MEASRQSKNISTTRSRKRQFSQVRQDYSQNSRASRSQDRSMRSSYVKKLDYNEHKVPTQTVRKPHKISSRRDNIRSQTQFNSKSATKNLCVGCFNHELYQARQRKKTREKQQQQHEQQFTQSIIQHNADHVTQMKVRYAHQYAKTNQFNLRKIQFQRLRKKQQERIQRENNAKLRYEDDMDNKRRIDMQVQASHQRRQMIRRELEQQIKRRKAKINQQNAQNKETNQNMFGPPDRQRMRQELEQRYRIQLIGQMNDEINRKKQRNMQDRARREQQADQIAQQSEQKERIRRAEAQRKRTILLEDARRRKEQQQRKKHEERVMRMEQERQRLAQLEQQSRIRRQKQAYKIHEQAEHYRGLKKQMHQNQIKKKEEEYYKHLPIGSILRKKSSIAEAECDSCQKRFPKQQLTRVVEPFQV